MDDKEISASAAAAAAMAAQAASVAVSALTVSVAVISTNVEYIKKDVSEIKVTTKEIQKDYISRREFIELTSKYDTEELTKRTNSLENWRWYILGIFAAVTVMVQFYLNVKK